MKTIKYIATALLFILFLGTSLTSCSASKQVQSETEQLAGYTLKNKKELMQQKISQRRNKKVLAMP